MSRKVLFIISVIAIVSLIFSVTSFAAVGDNLCLNATVVDYSGAVAAEDEQIQGCFDGDISTKWCSGGKASEDPHLIEEGVENWVVFDFGESKYFNSYQIFHASLCERDFGGTSYDTKSWIVEVSDDLANWKEVSRITDNTADHNDVEIELTYARYVRLLLVEESQTGGPHARISEFKVIESDGAGSSSEESAEAYLQAIEAAKAQADYEARMALIMPTVIYWACSLLAGVLVFLFARFVNKKQKKA